ncbi:MAG: aminoacyl-tRNA hydrolase [bacterium]
MHARHLFVGLGNPGAKYKHTRHNVGFMVIDELLRTHDHDKVSEKKSRIFSRFEIRLSDEHRVILLKPLTYMNRSGVAVSEVVDNSNIPLSNLLVILDDFNLPFGRLRFKRKGSAGGHNGLKSIIAHLQDHSFPRLRIGIGQEEVDDPVRFVLGRFCLEERNSLVDVIRTAAEACRFFAHHGITKTMNKYN